MPSMKWVVVRVRSATTIGSPPGDRLPAGRDATRRATGRQTSCRLSTMGVMTARYPQAILVACPSPWNEAYELDTEIFRAEVRRVLAAGFNHVYVFGTGGEGYAVDTPRFRAVVDLFREETRDHSDVHTVVSVIGLSTPEVAARLRSAR